MFICNVLFQFDKLHNTHGKGWDNNSILNGSILFHYIFEKFSATSKSIVIIVYERRLNYSIIVGEIYSTSQP